MLWAIITGTMQTPHPDIKAINEWVNSHVAAPPEVHTVPVKGLEEFAGGNRFYAVHFREYPIARIAPKPMSSRNVFMVDSQTKAHLFSTRKELEDALPALMGAVKRADYPKLLKSYLDVSKEFSQDGFFKFSIPEARFVITPVSAMGYAPVEPNGGDTGELKATLQFSGGKLVKIMEKDTIKPGVRPICQATKLLDSDPVVRKMAERDLLVMGKSAGPYLLEQRAKATPELKRAIDLIWTRILKGER